MNSTLSMTNSRVKQQQKYTDIDINNSKNQVFKSVFKFSKENEQITKTISNNNKRHVHSDFQPTANSRLNTHFVWSQFTHCYLTVFFNF